jgi:hypothetical protein
MSTSIFDSFLLPLEDCKKEVYNRRLARDKKRQGVFCGYNLGSDLDRLNKALTTYPETPPFEHPYSTRSGRIYEPLNKHSFFIQGGNGPWQGDIISGSRFLYRFQSLQSLIWVHSPEFCKKELRTPFASSSSTIDMHRNYIGSRWVNLKHLLEEYNPPRKFSFWTSENIDELILSEGVYDVLMKLGLVLDNYKPNDLIIMKFEMSNIDSETVKVPNCIDAYDNYIFDAQDDNNKPNYGLTIDIRNSNFAKGYKEYVVKNISVQQIEVKAIQFDKNQTTGMFGVDKRVLPNIKSFY